MAEVERAAGRKLTETEQEAIAEQVDSIVKAARLDDTAASLTDAIQKQLADYARDVSIAAQVTRRNAALNKRATLEAFDYVSAVWSDDPAAGLKALMGGVNSARQGARASIAASQQSRVTNYVQGFLSKLEVEQVHHVFASGALDREVWRAVEQLGRDTPNMNGIPVEAQKIAKIIEEHSEHARLEANKHGANIGKLPGYVMKQTHDMYKIREAGWPEYRDFVQSRLDLQKTMPELTPEKRAAALEDMWTSFASGVHVKFSPQPTGGFTGGGNIGKRLSHERVLHWKDADAAFEYNQRFGSASLAEGVTSGLEKMASDTALMARLGPNAEANLDAVITKIEQNLKRGHDPIKLEKFNKDADWLKKNLWPNITGENRIPHSHLGAKISSGVRQVQQMAKLGGALLSAITDIPIYAAEVRYQGGGMMSGIAEAFGGLVKGKYGAADKEIFSDLGVAYDAQKAAVMGRFDAQDAVPGALAKKAQLFFKANGLQWWTDSLRTSFALASSHRLARAAGGAWDSLDDGLRRTLGLYGIDSGRWDVMRGATLKEADGRTYLTPEGVKALGDEPFAAYLTGQGTEPTAGRISRLRDEMVDSFRSYYADRAGYAVLEPDAVTRSYLYGASKPGTWEGELRRHFMMFKSFTAAVIQKPLSREIYGRGEQTQLVKALKNGNGEMLGLANLMLWSTAFGYGAMALKDLAKGKTPRDITEDPVGVTTAAMLQGGALGIYGDFLFGEAKNRYGGGALDTFLGPTFGTGTDIYNLYGKAKAGEAEAGDAIKLLVNNTPFANLFYTKAALDYAFMYQLSESMSPGYLRRMERKAKEEKGQTYLFPPSQAIPYGGGNRLFEGLR
jgi:hypothetical protein